ncbi:MAG TPA: organic hydroperoxide resistance protein [Kofleriaceae bacterium]|jgi:Ohr subfamily peroxiredoxin
MQTLEKRMYTAVATAIGGRDGHAKSDDGVLDVRISPPKALGGKDVGTNPEQLFAAGYAACFGSALSHVARAQKITIGEINITARVTLGQVGQGFGLAVELDAHLPDLPHDQAQKLVEAAHAVCPYSNATRGNIEVDLKVT